jgi:hypothetical protein
MRCRLLHHRNALLLYQDIQTINLPQAEQQKFLKIAYDEGWKDIIAKNPKTGPEMMKLLTKTM